MTGATLPAATERTGERILVLRYRFIGDTLLTVPFLRNLRHAKPDARIVWVVAPGSADVVAGIPYVDELLYWDPATRHAESRGYFVAIKGRVGVGHCTEDLASLARGLQHRQANLHCRQAPFAAVQLRAVVEDCIAKLVDDLRARHHGWGQCFKSLLNIAVYLNAVRRGSKIGMLAGRNDKPEMLVRTLLSRRRGRCARLAPIQSSVLQGQFLTYRLRLTDKRPRRTHTARLFGQPTFGNPIQQFVAVEMGIAAVRDRGVSARGEFHNGTVSALCWPGRIPVARDGADATNQPAAQQHEGHPAPGHVRPLCRGGGGFPRHLRRAGEHQALNRRLAPPRCDGGRTPIGTVHRASPVRAWLQVHPHGQRVVAVHLVED
jgi:hypothetical protein